MFNSKADDGNEIPPPAPETNVTNFEKEKFLSCSIQRLVSHLKRKTVRGATVNFALLTSTKYTSKCTKLQSALL